MTRKPVPPEAARRLRRTFLVLAAFLGAGVAFASAARAAPLAVKSAADTALLAERVAEFRGASRVRWIVAGKTQAEADALVAEIGRRLDPMDRDLLQRIRAETFADAAPQEANSPTPLAWIAPLVGASVGGPACSWQVWVTDPALPSPDANAPVTVPLAPNDRMPVGVNATFRVGHSGLLQSKLYAFDETRPGAIRDLATVPDVDIPVAKDQTGETIFLAIARETAPFLEAVKASLASSQGERKDLGKEYALRERLLGLGRGIGANIQVISPSMLAPRKTETIATSANPSPGETGALAESCLYALTPAD
jgi:hypothetical protein